MKKNALFIFLLSLLFAAPADLNASPFKKGERIEFIVSWMGIPAGTTIMQVDETEEAQKKAYHLSLDTRSNKFLSTFYKVRNHIESFIDADSYSAIRFSARLRQGRQKKEKDITFNREKHQVEFVKNGKKGTHDVPENTFDSLSCFYYLRTKNLIPGEDVKIDTFSNGKLYNVTVKIQEKQRIKVAAGIFDTIKVQPLIKHNDVFSNKGDIFIWLTDDEKKVPVLIKTEVAIGSVMAEMTELKEGGEDVTGQGTAGHPGVPEMQGGTEIN